MICHNTFMTEFTLSQAELSKLKAAHRAAKKKREADHIKTIIFLGTEWTFREHVNLFSGRVKNIRKIFPLS